MRDRSAPAVLAAVPALPAAEFLRLAAGLADAALEHWLPPADAWPARLHTAMRYSVFAGGKRLRPALVLASCRAALGADVLCAPALAAVELLHTYTLVHDDLPAMDDDDLRRGRPTCHKAFDEATAILAGDALQTLAFEAASAIGAEAVRTLAHAAGSRGVIGGQQDDIDAEGRPLDTGASGQAQLERIHLGKTAALIRASCELGALAAGAGVGTRSALATFGTAAGLAFQIADDVLDATADVTRLGKTPGKDASQGKLTYVAVYGLDQARAEAARRTDEALAALAPLGDAGAQLRELARFIIHRDH